MRKPQDADYHANANIPTEYGGVAGDNLVAPNGRRHVGTPGERARDLRRAALRTQNDYPATGNAPPSMLLKR